MKTIGINLEPKSTLAAVLIISLIALFVAVGNGIAPLAVVAWPILLIAGGIWLVFIGLSIARNFGLM